MPDDALVSLCEALRAAVAAAADALTDFVGEYPAARQDLADLLRELANLQAAAWVLAFEGAPYDDGSPALSIPPTLVVVLKTVVKNANLLVDEVSEALGDVDTDADAKKPQAWLEHTAERLSPLARMVENAKMAMNLAHKLLAFVVASDLPSKPVSLLLYTRGQILQDASNLRVQLNLDTGSDDVRVQMQRPPLVLFVEGLLEYIEQTSTTRSLSVPLVDSGAPGTNASSLHSEGNEAVPDYHAIGITNPAPIHINLRHIVKKELSNHEVVQVSFLVRNSQPTIAVSTMDPPTQFFDTHVNPVSNLSNQHGVDMTFSPDCRTWAYLCEDDARDLNAWNHDGVTFKKPIVYVGDYINGRRIQQMRWPGVKPFNFSADGKWLAVGSARGRIALLNIKTGAVLDKAVVISCHLDVVTHAVFTPDGRALVSQSRDGTIRLSNPETGASIAKLETDTWKKPLFLGVMPDNDVVVSIWGDTVYHWNPTSGDLESYSLSTKRTREGWPIAVSRDCRFLCCRTDDGVDLSDVHSGRVLYTIKFQSGYATTAAFSWDGRYLVLGKAASWMGVKVTMSTLDVWELIF
ncbi:hypothetical protein G7046_g9187 [Stylonectria norvegica]|nr:hypothetical protein G7046_g9187 [Stylonectria norvegica]